MVSVLIPTTPAEKDERIAVLWEMETTGVVEQDDSLEAYFEDEREAAIAVACFAGATLRHHGQRDYVHEFQQAWQPVKVGRRFWLSPPWDATPAPEGRLRLEYQAGMACGSGAHPCTQLCLAALERCVRPGSAVLDVGVGSGILLMAAKLLGAARIAGCDIEHDCVVIARQALPEAALYTGSARSIRPGWADAVVANISAPAAHDLLPHLKLACRPGGSIILSGFRISESDFEGDATELDGWACVVQARP